MKRKIVLVSGASSGIGLEISRSLVKSGYSVIGFARRPLIQIKSAKELFLDYFELDVLDEKLEEKLQNSISPWKNEILGLVNNVGQSNWRNLLKIDKVFLDEMYCVNLKAPFLITKTIVQECANLNSIVNIASIAGRRGSANNSVYSSLKFANIGFTQSLAKELGIRQIRVNAVSPVLIRTPGLEMALKQEDSPMNTDSIESFLSEFSNNQSALQRLPESVEVAEVVSFLISSRSSGITGQNINVDCGVFPQ